MSDICTTIKESKKVGQIYFRFQKQRTLGLSGESGGLYYGRTGPVDLYGTRWSI